MKYDPPYSKEEVIEKYGMKTYKKLAADPAHKFRMESGIELIHKEPTRAELHRIYKNWMCMSVEQKKISDKKSIELFGVDNKSHFAILITQY